MAAVNSGETPPTSGQDGRAALVLGLAAQQSLLQRRAVRIADIDALPDVAR